MNDCLVDLVVIDRSKDKTKSRRFPKSRRMVFLLVLISLTSCQQKPTPLISNKTNAGETTSQADDENSKAKAKAKQILEFDSLEFRTAELKSIAGAFHEVAEKNSKADWHVERYRQAPYTSRPQFEGIWLSSGKYPGLKKFDRRTQLPHLEFTIQLHSSSRKKSERTLDRLETQNTWVPTEGWAARITYNEGGWSGYPKSGWTGLLRKVDPPSKNSNWFRFERPFIPLHLDYFDLKYPFRDGSEFAYFYSSGGISALLRPAKLQGASKADIKTIEKLNLDIETDFAKLFQSAEAMQEVLIKDIDRMRSIVGYEIGELGKVRIVDIRKIKQTTSIPKQLLPREIPDKPIDAVNKEAMLAQAYKKLDEREALIRDQRDEIYAAISKAVPFEIFEKLSKLENENSD